jgi:hypothetical protein
MMRLDAHQLFWKYHPAHQSWMTDQMQALRRDYLLGELQPLLQSRQTLTGRDLIVWLKFSATSLAHVRFRSVPAIAKPAANSVNQ